MPIVLWIHGLPASGKTTLAEEVVQKATKPIVHLDGDAVRQRLNRGLGFDLGGRAENVRRVAEVANLICDSGINVVVSMVTPTEKLRNLAMALCKYEWVDVFVDTPLDVCKTRDSKGHYAMAECGLIPLFTGIDSPFERSVAADIRQEFPNGFGPTVDKIKDVCGEQL